MCRFSGQPLFPGARPLPPVPCRWHRRFFAVGDLQAELHRDRIYGAHVAEYMEYLTEEDEAKYKEHFASYIENEITFEDVEDMYKETHKAIREDPSPTPKAAFTPDKSFKNQVGVLALVCLPL